VTQAIRSVDSLVSSLLGLPKQQREAEMQRLLRSLNRQEAEAIIYDWPAWARPSQRQPPGNWNTWLILSGRGWGKTRTGSETVREWAREVPRIALVGAHGADVRDVIVEGPCGILACSPRHERPEYEPSKRRLTWPNGSIATTFSADEPDALRGPEHGAAWCDELATWKHLTEAWDNLTFGLRQGLRTRKVITTTPRPLDILRTLIKDASCVVTRGSTYENAGNLAPDALAGFVAKYEGTRTGRQELRGEILDDVPGALWQRELIDKHRVRVAPELVRVVVAIDPAVTSGEDSDETGIVVAGKGTDGHFYVLADRTCRLSPDGWARRACIAYDEFEANMVVAEVNNGGDMVEHTLRAVRRVPYRAVRASRGSACAPSRSPRSTSRARCTTSGRCRSSRTRCAASCPRGTRSRRIASTRTCGR
jgi:phage terminase large subunit-like protein